MSRVFLVVLLVLGCHVCTFAASTGFEDLPTPGFVASGMTFTSGGIDFAVMPLPNDSGIQTSANGLAGGTGLELALLNSIGVSVLLPSTVASAEFQFGSYHPFSTLVVNGAALNSSLELSTANGQTLGGVSIAVTLSPPQPSGELGTVTLTGPINSLVIGGTELWIDNFSYAVPEPHALVACGAAAFWLSAASRSCRKRSQRI